MKSNLFSESYEDFKNTYFSPEMTNFIKQAYTLKRRCASLLIFSIAISFILTVIFLIITFSFFNLKIENNFFIGVIFFFISFSVVSTSKKGLRLGDYKRYYSENLSSIFKELTNTDIRIQQYDPISYQGSPFYKHKKLKLKSRNKGFFIRYRTIDAQMYMDTAQGKRMWKVLIRNIFIYLVIYTVTAIIFLTLGENEAFTSWILGIKQLGNPLSSIFVILYLSVCCFIIIYPFVKILIAIIRGITVSCFSLTGVTNIQFTDFEIWIKRQTNSFLRANDDTIKSFVTPKNELRFNRIDLNRDFDMKVEALNNTNLTGKMLAAKSIVNPLIEDLLSYMNKKYQHFDLVISYNRIDIQFLDDIMRRKKKKIINQLMYPVLFSNRDLYIDNMYKFYEIIELVKLVSKYFYCGNETELVTQEERNLLKRSADLEIIPASNFKKEGKKYLQQILNS